ncbi:hypothetical protein Y032_0017g3362 [Ancylostoma ceylanicum]|uniref:Uncharacterized protein n=1 Tax=Ancylostoma ceylanicum TaxID=53326 RepID=A0A016V6V4_9BILA|nr:hypothetical protein Y032_0017g3362 [Ancylostoma ceylanicum]
MVYRNQKFKHLLDYFSVEKSHNIRGNPRLRNPQYPKRAFRLSLPLDSLRYIVFILYFLTFLYDKPVRIARDSCSLHAQNPLIEEDFANYFFLKHGIVTFSPNVDLSLDFHPCFIVHYVALKLNFRSSALYCETSIVALSESSVTWIEETFPPNDEETFPPNDDGNDGNDV